MAWKVSFQQDTDVDGVGTATAAFTDDAGATVATFSQRVDTSNAATLSAFVSGAKAKLAATEAAKGKVDAVIQKIESRLNS